jgi:DNA-binding ferritin-like protein
MNKLVSVLLHSRTQAHVFHLLVKGPGSFAAHTALQTYYESIIPLLDGLVESYQGKYGLIEVDTVDGVDNESNIQNIIKYFEKLVAIIEKLRKDDSMQDSWVQNDIDTILTLIFSTKYKLENLA